MQTFKAYLAMTAGVVLSIVWLVLFIGLIERHHQRAMVAKVDKWNKENSINLTPLVTQGELTDAQVGLAPMPRGLTDAEVGLVPQPRGLTDAEVGLTNGGNGLDTLPAGKWAASLEYAEITDDGRTVYNDPKTGKLYKVKDGVIHEFTKPMRFDAAFVPPPPMSFADVIKEEEQVGLSQKSAD